MGCKDKKMVIVKTEFDKEAARQVKRVPLIVQNERLKGCNLCEYNVDGVCTEFVRLNPGKVGVIKVGVKIAASRCPLEPPVWDVFNPNPLIVEMPRPRPPTCIRCHRETTDDKLNDKKVCIWCIESDRPVAKKGLPPFGSAFTGDDPTQYVTSEQLQRDIKKLMSMIPPDTKAIVGVARSGLSAATMLSMYLHLPLYALRQTKGDIVATGNGWRLGNNRHVEPPKHHPVVVVDDTVMTGGSTNAARKIVKKYFDNFKMCSVYVNPRATTKPDFWAVDLGWPHLLEWNLFNSVLSPNMACDFDGVLCHDCPPSSDDDGPKYMDFLKNVKPLHLPKKSPIPLIVTARLEKYRAVTMDWLHRHGVRCHKLVMHPAEDLQKRNRDDISVFKARYFSAWAAKHRARPKPSLFVESDDRQAKRIHKLTKRIVVCTSSGKTYQ